MMGRTGTGPHLLSPSALFLPLGAQASAEATLALPSYYEACSGDNRNTLYGAVTPGRALSQVISDDVLLLTGPTDL